MKRAFWKTDRVLITLIVTCLPVGSIFADWRDGSFILQVSACRDEAKLYIAIYSPQDLALLSTTFASKALFKIGDQNHA